MTKLVEIFRGMSKKQKIILKVIIAFFVVCLIAVIVVGTIRNRKLSYSGIEKKMISAAEKYYSDNSELLPSQEGGSVSVDVATLVENKYMKELVKYKKSAESCSASVTVTNNNGLYLYISTLKCSDYETTSLYKEILNTQEVVSEGSGLYEVDGTYVFRGEYPNNYVKFADKTWRILSLANNEVRLIQVDSYQENPWDNRYNVNALYSSGITTYEISRIKDNLDTIYQADFNDREKSMLVSKQLCIGSRSKKETDNTGSVECSKLTENTYPVGLLQVNEYVRVSLDSNCKLQTDSSCTNYNYLAKLTGHFWTITPSDENDYEVYYISQPVSKMSASEYLPIRLVLNIDGSVAYQSGDGTVDNPYIIS
jgi:hypothetical protein